MWPFGVGRWGSTEDETARFAVAGEGSNEAEGVRDAGLAFETRDLATGSEGRGPVGGAIEGRDGRGSVVVAMVLLSRLVNCLPSEESAVNLKPLFLWRYVDAFISSCSSGRWRL